jgi:hypothetical protein
MVRVALKGQIYAILSHLRCAQSHPVAPGRTQLHQKTKVSAIISVHRFSACRVGLSADLSTVALAKVEALSEGKPAQNWLNRRKIKPNQT